MHNAQRLTNEIWCSMFDTLDEVSFSVRLGWKFLDYFKGDQVKNYFPFRYYDILFYFMQTITSMRYDWLVDVNSTSLSFTIFWMFNGKTMFRPMNPNHFKAMSEFEWEEIPAYLFQREKIFFIYKFSIKYMILLGSPRWVYYFIIFFCNFECSLLQQTTTFNNSFGNQM